MKIHAASSLYDDEIGPLCNQAPADGGKDLKLTADVAEVTCQKCIDIIGREDG